jgi:hypothetical protein
VVLAATETRTDPLRRLLVMVPEAVPVLVSVVVSSPRTLAMANKS